MYGKYSKLWRPWLDDDTQQQQMSTITRGIVSYTNVKFTREEALQHGYRNLHKSVKDSLVTDPVSKWDQYG
jgi:hypothetical protein